MKKIGFLIVFSLFFSLAESQNRSLDSSLTITSIGVDYAYAFPGGNMGKRFGNHSSIGGQVLVKLKSNYFVSVKAHYIFGNTVKEDGILDSIRTVEGGIIEYGGDLTNPILDESGYDVFISGGYIWPVFGPNVNSGFIFSAGIGFLQHQILIDYRNADIPQLEKSYRRGYDRLSNGLALNQFIGYHHHGSRRLINFYIGIDVTEAWTKNRRGYNYDTRETDNRTYFDSILGLRFGWMLSLYKQVPDEYYYY